MTDRPIIFSGPMILALFSGRKTITRRLIKAEVGNRPAMDAIHPSNTVRHPAPYLDAYCGQPRTRANPRGMSDRWCWWTRDDRPGQTFRVPYVPGDRLWVREAWSHDGPDLDAVRSRHEDALGSGIGYGPYYRATETAPDTLSWRSPIHMPRWASRLTLIVTDVRVERLQDISEADAVAEGMPDFGALCEALDPGKLNTSEETAAQTASRLRWPQRWFESVWIDLHGPDAWSANPWVAAVSFRPILSNIDALPADALAIGAVA